MAKQPWGKLQQRYANHNDMNNVGLLSNLLNIRYRDEMNMTGHVSRMESRFSKLATIGSLVNEPMKVVLLIFSLK